MSDFKIRQVWMVGFDWYDSKEEAEKVVKELERGLALREVLRKHLGCDVKNNMSSLLCAFNVGGRAMLADLDELFKKWDAEG
jgi:hypothetical protein